ncbi:LSM domain eukaryotic/archaea-type [Arabidopsis suecica]|nr:LSM domain eukaryotic/archaea-type [Arabidopsis suecica]
MGNSIFGRCGMSVDNFKAVKIPTPALTPFLFKTRFQSKLCLLQAESENPKLNSDFATMSRSGQPPDLKKYMDKKLQIKLNANRMVTGTLRGFDQFMNLVVDNTVEVNGNDKTDIGMVVIRGNSIVTVEALEPVGRSS